METLWYCSAIRCPGHESHLHRCDPRKQPNVFWYCGRVGCPGHKHPDHRCNPNQYPGSKWHCGARDCHSNHNSPNERCANGVWYCGNYVCPGHRDPDHRCKAGAALFRYLPGQRRGTVTGGPIRVIRAINQISSYYEGGGWRRWRDNNQGANISPEDESAWFDTIFSRIPDEWQERANRVNQHLWVVGLRFHDIATAPNAVDELRRFEDFFVILWNADGIVEGNARPNRRCRVYKGSTHPTQWFTEAEHAPDVNNDGYNDIAWTIPGIYILGRIHTRETPRRAFGVRGRSSGKQVVLTGYFVSDREIRSRHIPVWRDITSIRHTIIREDENGRRTREKVMRGDGRIDNNEANHIYVSRGSGATGLLIHLAGFSIGCQMIREEVGRPTLDAFLDNLIYATGGNNPIQDVRNYNFNPEVPYILVDINNRYYTLDRLGNFITQDNRNPFGRQRDINLLRQERSSRQPTSIPDS